MFDISLGKMLQPTSNNPDDVETPYIKAVNVQWDDLNIEDLPTMWASQGEIKALNLRVGDLLVCEGGEVGRASILKNEPPENCIYQNALHRVRSLNNDVRYLKYCLKQASEAGWFDVLCNRATIAHFTVEKFRELRIHIPSPETQRLIADYLDMETARIDALVAEKEKMLALLDEKRAALISRAAIRKWMCVIRRSRFSSMFLVPTRLCRHLTTPAWHRRFKNTALSRTVYLIERWILGVFVI
ncbi:MAG: restriction endonuclease subunit S [Proteobacteria bacterium]|nr:restriction endonuclease subunit S [Pseudomonadota bacterium]MBU1058965.1 restriction endonuclease subunit S [Pseudomonadota bacterium]